ncbi:MAG: Inosine-5'-monophosphate dehydrogenase [Alphaproteobacteria bacterium MarineAlpha6_Bin3]|nr:MAG: Inosine-5'-monophosphate dehydrogenase [Alphaproteobacteria bacterium MarineAlpha6_Bin3]|tara:strand:+ start:4289 stop:4717 length:429 start_codon:yes stop_codon:yes gene_type:complete
MLIRDILKKKGNKTITTSKETKIVDIAHILAKENIGAIVILEKEKVIGILSERDVVRGFIQKKSVRNTEVQELMTKNVFTCGLEDNNEDLLTLMVTKHFRHLPVIDKGKLVGVVSIGDLVKDRTKRLKKEIDQLKSYVTKSY